MNFLQLLGGLLRGYFFEGTGFVIFHLLVGLLVYRSWSRITQEVDALTSWSPSRYVAPEHAGGAGVDVIATTRPEEPAGSVEAAPREDEEHETTDILDQFIRESDQLGPQGLFVPISDFSDRLDSVVDGLVAELHDRTNLFLIVGIAGTLFGVFEFAYKSYDVLTSGAIAPGDRIFKFGEFLSGSMAKAFPVGFAGLVLTFISQIMTASPEARLRRAVSKATHLALLRRQQRSRSQAELVRDAVNAQAELVRGSVREIKEAMQPLADLRETLTHTIEPVIKTFGERLDQSLQLVQTQFDKLDQTTGGLQSAVDGVNEGVASLQVAADSLRTLTADTPAVIRNILEMQEQQQGALSAFGESFGEHLARAREINDLILGSADQLEKSSRETIVRVTAVIQRVGTESVEVWRGASADFTRQLWVDTEAVLTRTESKINASLNSMSGAFDAMSRTAGEVESALASIRSMPADVRSELESAFGDLKNQSLGLWGSMTNEFGISTQSALVNYYDQISKHANSAASSLGNAADSWERIARNAEPLLQEPVRQAISHAKGEITESLAKLDQQVGVRLPEVARDLQTLASGLGGLLNQIRELNASFGEWSTSADGSLNHVREFHLRLSQVLRDLTAIEGLRDAKDILPRIDAGLKDLALIKSRLEELKAIADTHKGGIFSIFGR